MTQKRFTLEMQYWKGNPQGRKLVDNLTGQDEMSVEELCDIASALHCKCEELESVNEVYENSLNKLEDENNELEKENEQLKQQLFCVAEDEGICLICEHHYLVIKPNDKYFISKCRKEHEECSKEAVRYCEDFELMVKE